jgi:hypothetical protein
MSEVTRGQSVVLGDDVAGRLHRRSGRGHVLVDPLPRAQSGDRRSPARYRRLAGGQPDRYVNVLGADIARQCLEAGELDEVLAIVAPVLLGDGTRLFEHPGGVNVRLERLSVSEVPHATNLWMRVVR